MGCVQNIDEERKMRLDLQFMMGLKEGSQAYERKCSMDTKWQLGR
jgi:hypothetical protein